MSMYDLVNVPVDESDRHILIEVKDGFVRLWNCPTSTKEIKDIVTFDGWRMADVFIGDHMFEPHMRDSLRDMIGREIVAALNRGIHLGKAKAKFDVRNALGIQQ